MWELDHKEGWVMKKWCFWTVLLEKTHQSSLDLKIKPVNPKRNQSWISIGKADAEAPILWPPDVKNWLIGKDPDTGQDWRQEEKGLTGQNGWMAALTQWAWVWANSRSWRWTGKPGVLQSIRLQRVRHRWATEQQQQRVDVEHSFLWLLTFYMSSLEKCPFRSSVLCWLGCLFWCF